MSFTALSTPLKFVLVCVCVFEISTKERGRVARVFVRVLVPDRQDVYQLFLPPWTLSRAGLSQVACVSSLRATFPISLEMEPRLAQAALSPGVGQGCGSEQLKGLLNKRHTSSRHCHTSQ